MTSTPLDSFRQDRPLAESIAVATRSIHARLNKLIIARLPLVLPPQAGDSYVYASGLLHIAPIYSTFESSWQEIVHEPAEQAGDDDSQEPETRKPRKPTVSDDLRETLDLLHMPGLIRTDRLVADIQSMTGWTAAETREQMAIVSKTGHLAEVVNHIGRAIKNKPHVLLAYSYIMYMALFAGGRFIRATLESAGREFWDKVATNPPLMPAWRSREPTDARNGTAEGEQAQHSSGNSSGRLPLAFFHFDTPEDGEDLKRDFKQKLADCEGMLCYQEKHDIVQEAICIFENMILVVAQLDHVMAAGHNIKPSIDNPVSVRSVATVIKKPIPLHRFRDSVVVTRERSARGSSNRASGLSGSDTTGDSDEESTPESNTTPARIRENTPLSHYPDNHPTIPSSTGIELCPGLSKSVRFEKTLPHPSRSHGGGSTSDSATDLAESLKMASKRLRREQVTNWVLGIAIGMIIVGALFSGRRAASLE